MVGEKKVQARTALCFLLGMALLSYFFRFGLGKCWPTNVEWMLSMMDGATHFLGWYFFKNEAWTFPLGLIQGYFAPLGTSIGYSDSLPLLALPAKLFARYLPNDFQYFGFWLALNYCAQAGFAFLLLRTRIVNLKIVGLGSLFFLFAPIFLWRAGHIALSSHWLILAAWWLYYRPLRGKFIAETSPWFILSGVSALVHPYLAFMVLAIAYTYLGREFILAGQAGAGQFLGRSLALAGFIAGLWYLLGFFQFGSSLEAYGTVGYGDLSLNLLAPFNPQGTSHFLPDLPLQGEGQRQTYSYLGLGMILLVIHAFLVFMLRCPRRWATVKGNLLILGLVMVLVCYAMSNRITLGERVLFVIPIGSLLPALFSVIRVSERFFWPVYYLLFFWVFQAVDSWGGGKVGPGLILILLLVQLYDLQGLAKRDPYRETSYHSHLQSPDWERMMAKVKKLKTVPMFSDVSYLYDYKDLALLAARHGCVATTGYVARASEKAIAVARQQLDEELARGEVESEALYVFNPDYFRRQGAQVASRLCCRPLDGYMVCEP